MSSQESIPGTTKSTFETISLLEQGLKSVRDIEMLLQDENISEADKESIKKEMQKIFGMEE